mgnify:CR=1 FL=1
MSSMHYCNTAIICQDSDEIRGSPYFDITRGRLRILGLMESDSGYFQCVADNSAGRISSTSQLIVVNEGKWLRVSASPFIGARLTTPAPVRGVPVRYRYVVRGEERTGRGRDGGAWRETGTEQEVEDGTVLERMGQCMQKGTESRDRGRVRDRERGEEAGQ